MWRETPFGGEAGTISNEAETLRAGRGQLLDLDGTNREEIGKERGRTGTRDADAPAGGPRGPNSDDPTDEDYDNDDYDYNSNEDTTRTWKEMKKGTHEDTREHKRTRREERNGEKW